MDEETAVVIVIALTVVAISAYFNVGDGREFHDSPSRLYTLPNDAFQQAMDREADGWFFRMTRCSFESFVQIAYEICIEWSSVHGQEPTGRGRPIQTTKMKKIALCMHYLASGTPIDSASAAFGINKSSGVVAVNQVLAVLRYLARSRVDCQLSERNLVQLAQDFESVCGFPDVVGAIDGTQYSSGLFISALNTVVAFLFCFPPTFDVLQLSITQQSASGGEGLYTTCSVLTSAFCIGPARDAQPHL